jgi:peptidoglycan/LPS O-acetylase OafA/YrhL
LSAAAERAEPHAIAPAQPGAPGPGGAPGARPPGLGRRPALDGIRALAILWVFAFHANALLAGGLAGPPAGLGQALAEKGLLGVELFFVLSGFLLALPWMRAAELGGAAPGALGFYRRRARRILPAYWLHMALLFALVLPLVKGSVAVLGSEVGRLNLLLHPLLLQFAHPGSSSSLGLNMALWSLTLEAELYLLLPLLAPLFAGRRVLLALPLALTLSLLWRALAPGPIAGWLQLHVPPTLLVLFDPISGRAGPFPAEALRIFVERQLPGELIAFALGMAAANLYCRLAPAGAGASPEPGPGRPGLDWAALGLLLLGPPALAQIPFPELIGGAAWRLLGLPLFLAGATVLVLAAALETPRLKRLLGSPLLAGLGTLSYSLYLWHEPVLRLVRQWVQGGPGQPGGAGWPGTAWSIALAFLAALALAALSYRLAERPWRARAAGTQGDRSGPGPGGLAPASLDSVGHRPHSCTVDPGSRPKGPIL